MAASKGRCVGRARRRRGHDSLYPQFHGLKDIIYNYGRGKREMRISEGESELIGRCLLRLVVDG